MNLWSHCFSRPVFLPNFELKIARISALYCVILQGRNPCNIWFVFWEKQWRHKLILKFTDLSASHQMFHFLFCQSFISLEKQTIDMNLWLILMGHKYQISCNMRSKLKFNKNEISYLEVVFFFFPVSKSRCLRKYALRQIKKLRVPFLKRNPKL